MSGQQTNMDKQCCKMLYKDIWLPTKCSRKAIVERDGKAYCKIHDPEYIKRKDEEIRKKREASECKKCSYNNWLPFYLYCPVCGTKRK